MKVQNQIVLLAVLAVGSLGIILFHHLMDDTRQRGAQRDLEAAIVRSERLSDMVHELQRERGQTAGHIGAPDDHLLLPLRKQWDVTDAVIARLPERMIDGADLSARRRLFAAKATSFRESFDYYSGHIQELSDRMAQTAIKSFSPALKDALIAHSNLVQAKEAMAQLRGGIFESVMHRDLDGQTLVFAGARHALFEASVRRFLLSAPPDATGAYRTLADSPAMEQLEIAVRTLADQSAPMIDAETWYVTASQVIDGLKTIEDRSLESVRRAAHDHAERANRDSQVRIGLLSLIATIIVAVTLSSIVRLVRALRGLVVGVASIMDTGDFSRRLPLVAWDEVNTVSKAFNGLLATADRLIQEKDHMATTDTLTGVHNRLKFIQSLEGEIFRHQRHGSPLSLMIFDIDHFKRVNDTFGHPAGDDVLKRVAVTVAQRVRVTDTFARWGGEEFVVLLPGDGALAAAQLADNLRCLIAGIDFGPVGQVTASFGVAEFLPGDDEATLCQRADEALYRAKTSGRNRACIAPGRDHTPPDVMGRLILQRDAMA